MKTEESSRTATRYHYPEPDAAACIAKSVAGIAIVGLIGVIGVSFNENGVEERNAQMNDSRLHAKASQQHVPATQQMQQTDIEASGNAQGPQRTAYRGSR